VLTFDKDCLRGLLNLQFSRTSKKLKLQIFMSRLVAGVVCLLTIYHPLPFFLKPDLAIVKDQMHNKRRERRSQIRDRDGFVLIVTMHMYTIYMRVDWFGNYLGRKDLHRYGYSISNYILHFLISHISSIFRYNNIWLVTTRLTLPSI
jgi:hypothetical protein